MSDKPVDYAGVKGSKKACARGYHAFWEATEGSTFRGEQCKVCGKKVMYAIHSTGAQKMLDEINWRKNHKIDLLQPWYPDGTVNPLYAEFYGDPNQLKNSRPRSKEDN